MYEPGETVRVVEDLFLFGTEGLIFAEMDAPEVGEKADFQPREKYPVGVIEVFAVVRKKGTKEPHRAECPHRDVPQGSIDERHLHEVLMVEVDGAERLQVVSEAFFRGAVIPTPVVDG